MRTLIAALLLLTVALSPAAAEFLVVPDGAIAPDGRLTYAVPPGVGVGAGSPYPSAFGPGHGMVLTYPVYYPALWVPALMTPDAIDRRLNKGLSEER